MRWDRTRLPGDSDTMAAMQLTHRFHLPAPVEEVFEAFSHLERLAPCFPGATVAAQGEDQLTGTLAVKVGPVPLLYSGTATYRERHAGRHRVVVEAHGKDSRGLGTAVVVLTTHLTGRGGGTDVETVTELELTGKPARYGTAVVSEVADKLVEQFSSCLGGRLTAGTGVGAADVAAPAVDPVAPGGSVDAVPPPPVQPRRARRSAVADPAPQPSRPTAATAVRRYGPAVAGVVVLVWLGLRLVRRVS
jgi:carbon monoxide dehydrogenase subunit G